MVNKLPEETAERILVEYYIYLKHKDKKIDKEDTLNLVGLIYQLFDGNIRFKMNHNIARIYYDPNKNPKNNDNLIIPINEFEDPKYLGTLIYNVAKDKKKVEIHYSKDFSTNDHADRIPKIDVTLPKFPYVYLLKIEPENSRLFGTIKKYKAKIKKAKVRNEELANSSVPTEKDTLYEVESINRIPEIERSGTLFGIDSISPNYNL